MKKYITYCRSRCAPRLSRAGARALQDFYVNIRDDVRASGTTAGSSDAGIPVTVRQLEALIRVSESLAKMKLRIEASEADVSEAIRLFRVSTMNASKDGGTQGLFGEWHEVVEQVETHIQRTLRIHHRVQTEALYSKLESTVRDRGCLSCVVLVVLCLSCFVCFLMYILCHSCTTLDICTNV